VARILVTGASGLVGSRLVVRLRAAHEVHGTFHGHSPEFLRHPADRIHRLDIRDPAALESLLARVAPDTVVHCAAMTDVDGCEAEPARARAANVAPVEALADWASPRGARLVQMSTDYVFDGEHPPYEVDAVPNPLCVYSKTKADAEAVAARAVGSLIVRSTVIYGADFGHLKQNFVMWLLSELRAGRSVNVVEDQWGTPTISENIAEFIEIALRKELQGVVHAAIGECMPRLEFARRIAAHFALDTGLIHSASTEDLRQKARRPKRPCLSMRRSERALGVPSWTLDQSLSLLERQLSLKDRSALVPWW